MAAVLGAVQAATTLLVGNKELSIDNWTFKLFYQWSVTLLVGFSVLVSANQFFGDPIQCDLPGGEISEKVLKSYCWMYSTFNIPPNFEGLCARRQMSENPMYNTYYQWVAIFLIFQSLFFYMPRVVWLMMEGGLMKFLGKGTTGKIVEDSEEKLESLLRTFLQNLQNKYNRYAFAFFGCELLNLVVVLSQFFITDVFLQNQFLFYGPLVFQFYQLPTDEVAFSKYVNPMCEVFPRVASCTYWKYGTGGQQVGLQSLCILSLNIVIDKIYLVIWYWYIILIILGAARVGCRFVQYFSGEVRFWLMKMKMHRYFKRSENLDLIRGYITNCTIGDWFVLYQMSKNLNRKFFYDFLIKLSQDVKNM